MFTTVLMAKNTTSAVPAVWQKVDKLQYPRLPQEVFVKNSPKTEAAFSDASITTDWPLVNIGFFKVFSPFIKPLKNEISSCSNTVTVAVIDTGIDYTHPGLAENLWINEGETGLDANGHDKATNGIDDDGDGFVDDVIGWDFVNEVPLPMDNHGHGTHISGIISAKPNATTGLSGVCPGVRIMPLKYYDNASLGYNNLQNTVRAIYYAVKMGAQIINYSGGGAEPSTSEKAAIEYARQRGVLFVAAAGNDGHNNDIFPYYPASYGLDNIISVASVDKQNQLLPSSNYGKNVQVAAPGLGILSTLPHKKTGTMSGTSQATAFVTGAAALLMSQLNRHGGTNYKDIKSYIENSTEPIAKAEKFRKVSKGLISLPRAVSALKDGVLKGPRKPIKALVKK
jgi:subtilisin family serine protease